MKRWHVLFLFLTILFLGLSTLKTKYEEPFSENLIAKDLQGPMHSIAEQHLAAILQNPCSYLGHGRQSIAFLTSDGQYVLKFFLKRPFHTKKKWIAIPSRNQTKQKQKEETHQNELQKTLCCYEWAFQEFKEETGLVSLHLYGGEQNLPSCIVRDSKGQKHLIDLNRASFIIQKKAVPLPEALSQMDRETILIQLERFLEKRAKKGYTDQRQGFNPNNFAWIEGEIIMIDPGRLIFSEKVAVNPKEEARRIMDLVPSRLFR